MRIKALLFTFYLNFVISLSFGQILTFKVPIEVEAKLGKETRIPIEIKDIKNCQIKMEGNPPSAFLKDNVFIWTPKTQEKEYYLVKFQLLDSTLTLIDNGSLVLNVDRSSLKPYLIFDRSLPDTIKLIENTTFFFSANIKSSLNADPRGVMTYFTFNENPNLRSFDSCRISVSGDQLIFYWTPSNEEALQEFIKFRITIIDIDQSVFSQVLNFRIKNINQRPYFKNEIPDTIYTALNENLRIDYDAIDPDHDKLKYDYLPKNSRYSLEGTTLVFKSGYDDNKDNSNLPYQITLKVSDSKDTIKRNVTIIRSNNNNSYFQPIIGDFTKKIFSEGDSVLTYLNVSNYKDLNQFDIIYTDLSLPYGIKSLTKYLVFEKKGAYIKVYSKGVIPYSLVDRDYNYNISVLLSSKDPNRQPSFKVLVLTIENKPDPLNIIQQHDSLIRIMNNFITVGNDYQSGLEKVHNRINRPWWKTAALITGSLSGVLTLVQSEHSDRTTSVISASVSLLSIMITNLPSLSEKTLAIINEKITNSKARIEQIQAKQLEFNSEWAVDMDQNNFDKTKIEIIDLVNKSIQKRNEDISALLNNKKIKKKIDKLINSNLGNNNNFKSLFQ